jgi:hypothetical protein
MGTVDFRLFSPNDHHKNTQKEIPKLAMMA